MANPTGRGGFRKGRSGNPGGRPRQLASVMHEARRHTLEALQVQLQLMQTAESESVRLNKATDWSTCGDYRRPAPPHLGVGARG
jgi:hypothetical protein